MRGGKTLLQSRMECVELSLVTVNDSVEETSIYEKSWNCENINHREKWRSAILKELNDIKKSKVFDVVSGLNKRTIGVKWVFKVKCDGRFRSRLVELGYRQISGIDYTDIHAPVLN